MYHIQSVGVSYQPTSKPYITVRKLPARLEVKQGLSFCTATKGINLSTPKIREALSGCFQGKASESGEILVI